MNSLYVTVLTESFLMNRGLQMILNKIRGINMVECLDSVQDLKNTLDLHTIHLIIVSDGLFEQNAEVQKIFKTHKNLRWALVSCNENTLQHPASFEFSLHYTDTEAQIQSKISTFVHRFDAKSKSGATESELSEREKEILKQVALGLTNAEIADKLFISQHTVITHRKNITSKLGIKTISGLTIYAILNDLIEMGDVDSLK